jgi:hypothetical protein
MFTSEEGLSNFSPRQLREEEAVVSEVLFKVAHRHSIEAEAVVVQGGGIVRLQSNSHMVAPKQQRQLHTKEAVVSEFSFMVAHRHCSIEAEAVVVQEGGIV